MSSKADVNIRIFPTEGGGFKVYAFLPDDEPVNFDLPQDRHGLENLMVNEVNPVLTNIVSNPIYSKALDIPPEICHAHLNSIAGIKLFDRIFVGRNPKPDALRFQTAIRELARNGEQKHIQIVAERFSLPWTLIYGEEFKEGENAQPNFFWGFNNVIDTPLV